MHPLAAAFVLGIVAGMRTFTAPAAVFLMRGGITGIVLAVLAVAEYIWDLLPNAGSRTDPPGLIARVISGGYTGYLIAGGVGAVVAVVGVMIGAYGGKSVRLWGIEKVGPIAAGLGESALALLVAAYVVMHT